jgi:protein-S-isoprenylcysteine O-methyltransferase Ste14
VTRHPLYLGWWLIHLGIGVCRGSAWVLATLPLAVLAEHPLVLAEEAELARRFGDDYDSYRVRVARYARIG